MKKVLAVLAALLILCSAATAETVVENMTDDVIYATINMLRNELLIRSEKTEGKVFIVDDDLVSIYFTGKWTEGEGYHNGAKEKYFAPELVLVNKTDKTINLSFDRFSVNGWELSYASGIIDVGAGNKKKGDVQIFFVDVDIDTSEEIEDFCISCCIRDAENGNKAFSNYKDVKIIVDRKMWE